MWLYLPAACRISACSAEPADSTLLSESQCQRLAQFATVSGKQAQPASWRRAWKTGVWTLLRSGVMSEPSLANSSVTAWLESLGVFPAPTSASPENKLESTGSIADSGFNTSASFAKCGPGGSLLKTSPQSSLFQQEELYLEGLPKSFSMRKSYLFERPTWERPIAGSGSLFSPTNREPNWNTPSTEDMKVDGPIVAARYGGGDMKTCDQRLRNQAQHWPTPDANTASYSNGLFGENLREKSVNWPTPDANVMNDGESLESFESRRQRNIAKHDNQNGMGTPLAMKVRLWKTPHGMSGMDHTGKVGGGGEFAKQAVNWPSPRSEDSQECGNHPGAMDSLGG